MSTQNLRMVKVTVTKGKYKGRSGMLTNRHEHYDMMYYVRLQGEARSRLTSETDNTATIFCDRHQVTTIIQSKK